MNCAVIYVLFCYLVGYSKNELEFRLNLVAA